MSTQADVKSIDTLAFMKAAFASFAHESGQAISECEIQGQRAVDWICVDQAAFWKAEVRRMTELVNKAVKDLEYCKAFKKVGNNQPSCVEEKKALEKAKQRLARAEQKAEAVRRWTPVVQQQFREACVRLVRFREVVDVDCPRSMALLEKMLKALDAYRQVASPTGDSGTGGGTGGQSVARQLDGGQAAKPEAAPPPPAGAPPS
ncbi:MAG: hypothetical protein KJS77_01675 [Planctomycetes bacterium]|nr:hypothetical protein [Planctomycetota bacterium]